MVQGNYIGLNAAGTAAIANFIGIDMFGVKSSTIGGTDAGTGNVVSGNTDFGVRAYLIPQGVGGPNEPNIIQGNLIGTNPAGDASIPNGGDGISLSDLTFACTIGGTTPAARNVISGNGGDGIQVDGDVLVT